MEFNFAETMRSAKDAELIKIVTINKDNYQPAAVAAAEVELAARNLSVDQIEFATALNEREHADIAAKATEPLDIHWKILACVFPVIPQLLLAGLFKSQGYDRKSNELVKWTLYGIAGYILLIVLIRSLS